MHVIDAVLLPPADETPSIPAATPGVGNSVYDNIYNDPSLSTLLAAIDAAGLADTLDNEATPFTVFAPTNDAFQALEDSDPTDDLLAGLLADPDALAPILTYHVLAGTTDATAATGAAPATLTTVNGATVELATSTDSPSGLSIGGASITLPDSNYDAATSVGVVHVIDAVLLPPAQ